ncbi:protein 4.1b isoform X3 [Labeo rohita]|uniref:protein 4.1b isoform X3 n=1 Tax=Labeo rohita TaxID=84645 RepID=UPI0021E1DF5B|nr:protein 4.1b isoform X3 [Labeo rohita]
MLLCRVHFLDDTYFEWKLERNSLGQDLFNKVCEHLELLERDYYGLVMWDSSSTRVWLDRAKEIRKQIKSPTAELFFNIKFYPPDPSVLAEDITRYFLCLQLRKDILMGRLPCPPDILALLGSYTVQSTLGDYDPNLHRNNYVSKIVLAPSQSEELEERIMELHSTYRFMSPAQADILFLENAMGLPMYGVDLHPAKDVSGADVMLGICSEGLMVYEDEIKTNIFLWPKVLKISHKRNTFLLKMRPSEQDEDEDEGVVSFRLANYRACKQLWKCCVEHHSFFRNRLQDTKTKRLLTLGSRFRYHGRTQSECLEASGKITRPPPGFTRFIIKRKGNEEILDFLKQPIRTELDDWFLVYGPDKWRISTTDDVMLDSEKLEEWKHHADDWCVLFDGTPFLLSEVKQPLQFEEQREDVQVVEGSEERLTDELVIKQSYKAQVIQEGSDINVKELPDFELKQEIMKPLKETLNEEVLEVNGERIQRVVITKQWTQEVNSSVESQENADKKIEMLEMVERHVMVTEKKTMGSEGTFETLEVVEQRLEDLDAIKRKLDEVEELRFGLQEVESLEQRLQQVEKVELQQAETDEWYILLDRWPLMLTATPRGVQEDLQQIVYNPKPMMEEDSWYILFDVLPKAMEISRPLPEPLVYQQLQGPTAELYEAKEVIQSRVTTEEQVIEVTTVSAKEEIIVPEKKRTSIIQTPQFPVVPRDIKDDWFQFFDKVPYEQESFPSEIRVVPAAALEAEEKRAVERRRKEEEQIQQQEQVTAVYRQPEPVILEQRAAKPPRDVEDDWFIISDVSPKDSVPLSPQLRGPAVELYEETREEVITSRVRTEEQVTEVITMSAKEQIIVPEKKRTSIIQTPQFPVVPRDIEDDWFQLFDKVPYEQKIFPSDVRIRDFEVHEPIRDQRVVEEQMRETRLVTEEKRVVFDERIERADVVPQMIPVGDRKVDDDWFEILRAPSEMRSVTSVSVATEERRIKEQEERRVRQQEIRVREEEERRLREQEKRKQELEARKAQPVITVKTEAQPQIEKDDDWYILFDVSPKETVVTDVLKVDRRVEEENWRREQERREEERRKQIKIEEATKRPSVPEKKPVQLQTEVEHDWFTLMGVSRKDYVPTIRPTPVISPVAPPKPRPQIPTDQPLTSTPTAKPVSTIKTHEETTKDMWDITLESEKSATESVLMRKSRRSEGESIYTRHSILMLKDLDMSHEMILKHNASVTELKRVFMEVKQEFGPTEWDRRLSSYSPTAKAQLPHLNEEILMRMGLIEEDGKTIVFRQQELIYV